MLACSADRPMQPNAVVVYGGSSNRRRHCRATRWKNSEQKKEMKTETGNEERETSKSGNKGYAPVLIARRPTSTGTWYMDNGVILGEANRQYGFQVDGVRLLGYASWRRQSPKMQFSIQGVYRNWYGRGFGREKGLWYMNASLCTETRKRNGLDGPGGGRRVRASRA